MTKFSFLNRIDSCLQLFAREEVTLREKIFLLFNFYKILLLRKFNKRNIVDFMGYKIDYISRSNLEGIIEEIFIKGDYFVKLENKSPTIIDCGGNIGLSALFFKRYYPTSRITIFEPSKTTFYVLSKNIERNKLSGIKLINAAVSDTKGDLIFYKNKRSPGSSTTISYSKSNSIGNDYVEEKIKSVLLSDYIDNEVDLLKVDIEGGENKVFKDLDSKNKLGKVKEIVFEYHDNISNTDNGLCEILEILEKNKFRTIIYGSDFALSSEKIKSRVSYHFMVRAYKV